MTVAEGQAAPDFRLDASTGKKLSLKIGRASCRERV